jgi:hypothetical protein
MNIITYLKVNIMYLKTKSCRKLISLIACTLKKTTKLNNLSFLV